MSYRLDVGCMGQMMLIGFGRFRGTVAFKVSQWGSFQPSPDRTWPDRTMGYPPSSGQTKHSENITFSQVVKRVIKSGQIDSMFVEPPLPHKVLELQWNSGITKFWNYKFWNYSVNTGVNKFLLQNQMINFVSSKFYWKGEKRNGVKNLCPGDVKT